MEFQSHGFSLPARATDSRLEDSPTIIVACPTAAGGQILPEALAQAIAGWDVAASQGALFDDSQQLSALMGRPTTPLSPRSLARR
jgi:hypothetical protein